MKLTKQLKAEIADVYEAFWGALFYADIDMYSLFLDEDYRLIGTTEQEFFFSKAEAVRFLKATADQLAGNLERRNSRHKIEIIENLVFITDQFDAYVLIDDKWSFYEKTRVTTLLQEKKDGWKIIQQHFSFPDNKAGSGQTIGLEKIAKENLQLKEAIRRRTIELELKNKELEIEFSLERVRAVAMGMKQPADMLEVCEVITRELISLGVGPIRNIQTVVIDIEKETYQNYEYYQVAREKLVTTVAYKEHPTIHAFVKRMVKDPEGFYARRMIGDGLKKWLKYQAKAGQFVDPTSTKAASLHYYFYSIGSGALGITTYAPLSKEAVGLFKRFRNVFQLAYARFVDIQQAEEQAKEARVQLAMERVRARTMAMQSSDELPVAANLLFQQVQSLGMPAWSAGYCIWDDNKKGVTLWMSSEGVMQPAFHAPLTKDPSFIHMREAFEKGRDIHVEEVGGKALVTHYKYMRTLPVVGEVLDSIIAAGHPLPVFQIFHCVYFSHGFLLFITYEPVPEAHVIFKRFGTVFDQTYTRFLDLLKAEAQAREAQIETSLERVRSRSMAMHKSEELADLSLELVKQVQALGVATWFCAFNIKDDEVQGSLEWGSNGQGTFPTYRTPREGVFLRYYEAGQKGETLLINEIGEAECPAHYEYLCTLPGLGEQLLGMKNAGIAFPVSQIDHVAFFKYGYIIFITYKAVPESHDIFVRFARIFEQTYTRFLDLKKAEAQAKEAQIEAALEKVRSRTMAMQSSNELQETAAVLFNEFKKLGTDNVYQVTIGIYNEEEGLIDFRVTSWAGSGAQENRSFKLDMNEPTVLKPAVDAWKANKKSLVIDLSGETLEGWLNYRNKMSGVAVSSADTAGRRVITVAYYSKGHLSISTPVPVPTETQRILERFAAVFDSTYTRFLDLKKAEAQALRAEQDLMAIKEAKQNAEEALAELQTTQKQLIQAEKMASLGELTAGIAHEIQNPLNFVNNFSEVSKELLDEMKDAIEKGDTEEAKDIMNDVIQNLEKINHHGKRADGIVKGMLQHSRSSSGVKEPTDINALADEYLRLAYHGLRAKDKSFNATLKTEFDDTIGSINVIPQDIGRVILNLISNAFYAVNEQSKKGIQGYVPTVEVGTKRTGNKIEVMVKDNGNGIPARVLDKIFQPFFTTKPTGQGTGLGLSLSYDIVKSHGGELKVDTRTADGDSVADTGTTFTIYLPVI